MIKIAIHGHPTRGKEVIQILESLGGKNKIGLNGRSATLYYIDKGEIRNTYYLTTDYKIYTLEEFEKEFPFKIGDKVTTTGTKHPKIITGITDTQWGLRYVISEIKFPDSKEIPHISQIYLYKEMEEERNITLTLSKAKEWYQKGGELKEVALQAYTEEELTKIELPKTWGEFCENYPTKSGEWFISNTSAIIPIPNRDRLPSRDKNIVPSRKAAEAHLALMQLHQLRDVYRQGWVPNWEDKNKKFIIYCYMNTYSIDWCNSNNHFLAFQSEEIAKTFLTNFRDLIEKAGDLI